MDTDVYTAVAEKTGVTRQYVKTKLYALMYTDNHPKTIEEMIRFILMWKQIEPEVKNG